MLVHRLMGGNSYALYLLALLRNLLRKSTIL